MTEFRNSEIPKSGFGFTNANKYYIKNCNEIFRIDSKCNIRIYVYTTACTQADEVEIKTLI